MIHVIGPTFTPSEGVIIINTTSRSDNWSRSLSPFFLGPIDLYLDYKSINMENAWQYSKCYEYYLEEDNSVGERYFQWAQEGWSAIKAHRYPMGKEAKPLFSYWDGDQLSYVEARKKIYLPLYSQAVQKTYAYKKLVQEYKSNSDIYLWDFDAHSLTPGTFDYWDLWNNPNIKVGHAYVLAMLLEGII